MCRKLEHLLGDGVEGRTMVAPPDGFQCVGADVAAELGEGSSRRQGVTEQREELREAVIREALLRYPDRPSPFHSWTCYPQPESWASQVQHWASPLLSLER